MKTRKQTAWVAVSKSDPDFLTAGYWIAATKEDLMKDVQRYACFPNDWTARRVTLTPATQKKGKKR